MTCRQHIYLIPGIFGFGELAGYVYFEHLERELSRRLQHAGVPHTLEVIPTPPTASLRRRAHHVAEHITRTTRDESIPIHIIGHSTGGLDARLVATPTVHLESEVHLLQWRERLRSIVTVNTPHYGTPLAQFFTTVSGTRFLYALSLLTVTSLKLGGWPLTVFSSVVAAAGRIDETLGVDIHLLDRATDLILRFIGERGQSEVRNWLDGVRQDQGGIVQITPEGMDLFNAAAEDSPSVRYGCVATASPPPAPVRFMSSLRSPYAALSATIYSTLHAFSSMPHKHYAYPAPHPAVLSRLEEEIGRVINDRVCDGVVPTLSMLWGELVWCGSGDHLDIVGHFADDQRPAKHTDWLNCGTAFGRERFQSMVDAIANFIHESASA